MKLAVQILIISFFGVMTCAAQETESAVGAMPSPTGFEWLKQFEGEWVVKSASPGEESGSAGTSKMSSRTVGSFWIVSEQRGQVGAMRYEAVQTIGYDSTKKQFTGTWVDSMMSHTWHYSGSLDATGKKLTLDTEGPDWRDATKHRSYRDVFEFKSKDEIATQSQVLNADGTWETFMTSQIKRKVNATAKVEVKAKPEAALTPFLMFESNAEQAIELYKTVFADTTIVSMEKYKAGEAGKEGSVKVATIEVAGQRVMCIDSPAKHDFTFTPSFSFFVECENEQQLKGRFEKLSQGGKVMMPIGNYGFSKQFGWTSDKYGVSWQLNLK